VRKNDATKTLNLLVLKKFFNYNWLNYRVIGNITSKDKLDSREEEIFADRDRKLEYS
jgi:hypothetical protein